MKKTTMSLILPISIRSLRVTVRAGLTQAFLSILSLLGLAARGDSFPGKMARVSLEEILGSTGGMIHPFSSFSLMGEGIRMQIYLTRINFLPIFEVQFSPSEFNQLQFSDGIESKRN